MTHYRKPGAIMTRIMNPLVAFASRLGLGFAGSRVLAVRGRKSGEWRTTPVNPLVLGAERYLVAPRGRTQWVRNLRASKTGELRHAGKTEPFRAEELSDAQKVPVLREYLKRWKWEAGQFFDGRDANASDEELLAVAPDHPVFRIQAA